MVRGRTTGRGTRRGTAAESGTERPVAESTPTPGPSEAPASASDATISARRGSSTRATKAPSTGRFRPKNIRRDEAERDTLARQEQQKADERAAEERKANRGRSRFRSKRSRGDTMGRGGFGRIISGASGPFSGGMASSSGPSRGGFGRGGFGGGGDGGFGGRSVKSESKGPNFAHASDRHLREARINADRLHVMTQDEELDSDDEAMMAALSTRSASVMPMGIYRKEHKEAEVVVATTAELEAKENATGAVEESLWVDGESGSLPPVDQPEEGVWDTGSKAPVRIKAEPGTEDDVMDLDPTSTATPTPVPESKPEAKPEGKVVKVRKALSEDPESKMIQSDLDLLAKELGGVSVEKNGESTAEMSNKEGRLYLFQFPPLMPPLRQTGEAQPPINVKDEDTKETNVEDIPASADGLAVDLTQDDAAKEEDDTTAEEERKQAEFRGGFRKQLLSQGGMIGTVNVRKSGKVELNWGGQILEMSPAAGMNFLTTAAILEESDEKPKTNSDGGPPTGGDCVGMGKIMGRFTLAPVWSEEEDWNVAPEELETA